jgi:5-methylcytosine-specific restriction endonuclease McrA
VKPRPTIPLKAKYEVLLRQASCFYCGNPFVPAAEEEVEYDHVTARALGGSDDSGNLVASCKACHRQKTNGDLKKISFERRREDKRKRAAEKRALEKLAKKEDLLKLIIRGSDLKVIEEDDESGPIDPIRSSQARNKARPKTAWPKRGFGGRLPRERDKKNRQKDCQGNQADEKAEQN